MTISSALWCFGALAAVGFGCIAWAGPGAWRSVRDVLVASRCAWSGTWAGVWQGVQ